MAKRLALEWAFDALLAPQKERLIESFKPAVSAWANKMYPKLRKNLRGDPLAGCSTATDMLTFTRGDETAWVFVAMFVNRDIGDDVTAMVAGTEDTARLMAEAFLEAMRARMGNPTRMFN